MTHQMASTEMTKDMQGCMENCQECHALCLRTIQHCLALGGPHAEAAHIAALMDCAEACRSSADFMLRGSAMHGAVCGVCADACRACEVSCRKLANEGLMKECADACRACAESCEQMAGTS